MNDQTAGKNLKQVLYSIFYWRDNRYGSDDVFTECKFQLLVDRLHFYRKDIEFLEKFYVELLRVLIDNVPPSKEMAEQLNII